MSKEKDRLGRPLSKYQMAVGKCPHCGDYPTWFNDVPLRAFCWGPDEENEHEEWSKTVPNPIQPYVLVEA